VKNAQAAIDDVKVKQIASKKKMVKKSTLPEPIMPKSFAGTNKKSSSQSSEIDSSISAAEKSQNGSDATEEVNDSQISGSENMWES